MYIDVFFMINVCLDVMILFITKLFLKHHEGWMRLVLGAITGGIYSVIALMTGLLSHSMALNFGNLCAAGIMSWISFRAETGRTWIKQTIQLYIVTFIAGGIMNMLYYTTPLGVWMRIALYGKDGKSSGVLLIQFLGITIAAYLILYGSWQFLKSWRQENKNRYPVRILSGDCEIRSTALFDTGNALQEPVSKQPVHLAEYELIKPLWKEGEEKERGLYVIPYQSVGMESGVLYGIRVDCMFIGEYRIDKPIIAVYKGKLSARGDYGMILNSETFEDCSNERIFGRGE